MVFVAIPVGLLGFTITSVLVCLTVPLGLFTTIQTLWSWHAIGDTRKCLSSLLILFLWWTVPLVAIFLLAWSWAVVGILLEACMWVLPPVLVFLGCYWGVRGAAVLRAQEAQKPQAKDDITISELACVLLVAVCCFFFSSWFLMLLTFCKGPLIFASTMYHGSCRALAEIWALRDQLGGWICLVFVGFGVAFCLAMPCVMLAIGLSLLLEVVLVTLWPPFVSHYGFLGARKPQLFSADAVLSAGKAAYQVIWLSEMLQNAVILGRLEVIAQAYRECLEMKNGRRHLFSSDILAFAVLPPISIQ